MAPSSTCISLAEKPQIAWPLAQQVSRLHMEQTGGCAADQAGRDVGAGSRRPGGAGGAGGAAWVAQLREIQGGIRGGVEKDERLLARRKMSCSGDHDE